MRSCYVFLYVRLAVLKLLMSLIKAIYQDFSNHEKLLFVITDVIVYINTLKQLFASRYFKNFNPFNLHIFEP